jgi:hypothetical protein
MHLRFLIEVPGHRKIYIEHPEDFFVRWAIFENPETALLRTHIIKDSQIDALKCNLYT